MFVLNVVMDGDDLIARGSWIHTRADATVKDLSSLMPTSHQQMFLRTSTDVHGCSFHGSVAIFRAKS